MTAVAEIEPMKAVVTVIATAVKCMFWMLVCECVLVESD